MSLPRLHPAAILLAFGVSAKGLYAGFFGGSESQGDAVFRFIVAVIVCNVLVRFLLAVVLTYQQQNRQVRDIDPQSLRTERRQAG